MKPGTLEMLVVLAAILLIFGPKNLPKLGKMFGKTVSGFKKGMEDIDDSDDSDEEEKNEKQSSKKKKDDDDKDEE